MASTEIAQGSEGAVQRWGKEGRKMSGVIGGTWKELKKNVDDGEEDVPLSGPGAIGMRMTAKRLTKKVQNKQFPLVSHRKKDSTGGVGGEVDEDETRRWTEK